MRWLGGLFRRRRFFVRFRYRLGQVFAQDRKTFFLCGRWIHAYSLDYDVWFSPMQRERGDQPPERSTCTLIEIPIRDWWRLGRRARLELLEDVLGRRFWTAKLDMVQDYSQYERDMERPKIMVDGNHG